MPDVIIVGGGPAGSVLAALLAQRAIDALLLDKATFPRPKICGDYLSPGTVGLLDRLDLLPPVRAAAARPLRGMTVISPDGTAFTAAYPATAGTNGVRPSALCLPRTVLDQVLLEHARQRGAKCREGFQVTDLIREGGRVCGVRGIGRQGPEAHRAQMVVGADGRHSVLARRLDLFQPHPRLRRMAMVTYYEGAAPLRDRGLICLGDRAYCILNPVGGSLVNAAIVLDQAIGRAWKGRLEEHFDRTLPMFRPALTVLRAASRCAPVRCLGPLAYRARRTTAAGALLIGDAAGFYDPFTGEGVFHALQSAERAARAIAESLATGGPAGPLLARFDRQQRRALVARELLGTALQAFIRRPAAANSLARLLVRHPPLADLLMGVIGNLLPARMFLTARTVRNILT